MLAALRTQHTSCLCMACLRALAAAPAEAMKKAGPVLRPAGPTSDQNADQSFL